MSTRNGDSRAWAHIFPSLVDLYEYILRHRAHSLREQEYRTAVLNKLDGLLSLAGQVFDCAEGHNLADLMTKNWVLELDFHSSEWEAFDALSLLVWMFSYLMVNFPPESGLRQLVIIDEVQRLFSRSLERRAEQDVSLASLLLA